jgi:hypothetical protein
MMPPWSSSIAAVGPTALTVPGVLAAPFTRWSLAVVAVAAGCVVLVALASIVYRLRGGKPLFKPDFGQPLFAETWRSGRSLRNAMTRIGGARNCLWVAVTGDALHVAPHFPFNLLFLPEIYALEHTIPASATRSVKRQEGALAGNRVRIGFARPGGAEEVLELSLSDPEGFVRAVEAMRGAGRVPAGIPE